MAANTRDIKLRIVAVKNIKKITETMEKIATAKTKKATNRLNNSREYYVSLLKLMRHLIGYLKDEGVEFDHPLIQEHNEKKTSLILTVTSNRGLCGGYNNNILNTTKKLYDSLKEEGKNVKLYTIGKKAVTFFKFAGVDIDKSFLDIDENVQYERMAELAQELIDLYSQNEVDEIHLLYTKYFSASRQKPVLEKVLPFEVQEEDEEIAEADQFKANYIFEPSSVEVLSQILPVSIKTKVFNTLLEATLSEQISRKIAMKQASDAAGDMIKDLTGEYNRARQGKITNELIDIMGAVKAMKE